MNISQLRYEIKANDTHLQRNSRYDKSKLPGELSFFFNLMRSRVGVIYTYYVSTRCGDLGRIRVGASGPEIKSISSLKFKNRINKTPIWDVITSPCAIVTCGYFNYRWNQIFHRLIGTLLLIHLQLWCRFVYLSYSYICHSDQNQVYYNIMTKNELCSNRYNHAKYRNSSQICLNMMTSSNGNIFRVTDLLCGEFPSQKPVKRGFDASFDPIGTPVIWHAIALIMTSLQQYIRHYDDVIMGTIASQITSLTIVYSTVYSDADHRKHQSSTWLAFVRGIHRGPVNSPHKWPVPRKMFPFDDVIMILLGIVPMRQVAKLFRNRTGIVIWQQVLWRNMPVICLLLNSNKVS